MLPLGLKKRGMLDLMKDHITKQEFEDIRYLAKLRRVGFHSEQYGTSKAMPDASWPQLSIAIEDEKWLRFCEHVNQKVADGVKLKLFDEFKQGAIEKVSAMIAPNILGMEMLKTAAAMQLFAQEPVHVLLIGDPGTGKTEILRSIEKIAPTTVFGLGSGASKAGLTGMYEGKEFIPGILVLADEGIALIDELNLLKKEDRAGLYSAMEKGFITYDKKGKHERHNARVRMLATANPKGDKFIGKDVKFLKSQLPFDDALLSRFHLMFIVRKPSAKELEMITRRIVKQDVRELPDGDATFVSEYVSHAEKLNVSFDGKYESMVVDFIEDLKEHEKEYIVEVGPRLVVGIIRIAKAYARARLARHVSGDDLESALRLVKGAMKVEVQQKV